MLTQENFFFPDRLNIIFIQLYVKFRCLHFASRVADAKKINLANLKHKNAYFCAGLARYSVAARVRSFSRVVAGE